MSIFTKGLSVSHSKRREEAKTRKKEEEAEARRIKNFKARTKTEVRKANGGTGVKIVFFNKAVKKKKNQTTKWRTVDLDKWLKGAGRKQTAKSKRK